MRVIFQNWASLAVYLLGTSFVAFQIQWSSTIAFTHWFSLVASWLSPHRTHGSRNTHQRYVQELACVVAESMQRSNHACRPGVCSQLYWLLLQPAVEVGWLNNFTSKSTDLYEIVSRELHHFQKFAELGWVSPWGRRCDISCSFLMINSNSMHTCMDTNGYRLHDRWLSSIIGLKSVVIITVTAVSFDTTSFYSIYIVM